MDDRIRILLIDDDPARLWKRDRSTHGMPLHPGFTVNPRDPIDLESLFEVRWIATPEEARDFRDLARLVAEHAPGRLPKDGWMPEVVVIDYLLKGSAADVRRRMENKALHEKVSPLPVLEKLVDEMGLVLPTRKETFDRMPDREADYGCFAGGMCLALFSDHPCVPVTITANTPETIKGRMTEFFEWLLAADTNGNLRAAGEIGGLDWRQITSTAAARLRKRIEELARLRTISISLGDLLQLAEGHELSHLAVESKYGPRHLPIPGLFCDKSPNEVTSEAEKWATQLLGQLLGDAGAKNRFPDLKSAVQLAETIWKAYLDHDLVKDRLELARLVSQVKKGEPCDEKRLRILWERFSTKPFSVEMVKESRARLNREDLIAEIRSGSASNLARRWACLMILVRLLQLRFRTKKEFCAKSDLGEAVTRLLCAELQEYEVYLAWFPVAGNPVDMSDITSSGWKKVLDRDVDDPSEVGVSLNIRDLLRGRSWGPDKDDPRGLRRGERELMSWYALSLDPPFSSQDWRPSEGNEGDEQTCRIMLGGK